MSQSVGKQSIQFENPPYLMAGASVVGKKEGEGPLGDTFDRIVEDDLFGGETWEEAEGNLQKMTAKLALDKAGMEPWQIKYIFAGDLLEQNIATSFGLMDLQIPLFGLFGACSTAGEALSLGAMAVAGGYAEYVAAITSSHFASAEKQFRFPLEYASQRPLSSTWTVTGSGAFVLGTRKSNVWVTGITTGKVVDFGLKDSQNMGAAMAPAACDTIYQNFMDFNRAPGDYDKIITGDLGAIGQRILLDLLSEKGFDISGNHLDCGMMIFDSKRQDTHAGGSGCGCSASVLGGHILGKLERGEWKRVLFVPTGALMSKVSFNEGKSVPGIAHGVVLEHCETP